MKLESIFDPKETRRLKEEALQDTTSNKKVKVNLATTAANFSKRSKSTAVDFNKTFGAGVNTT